MLVGAAEQAGMKVPPDVDEWQEWREDYPHFFCFCLLQLARPTVYHGEHWDNAKVVAEIPDDEIMTLTLENFLARGLSYATAGKV